MRIAYVAPSIPLMSDMDASSFTLEGLIDLSKQQDIVVFVDESTAGSEALSRSGVTVSLSPKRQLEVSGSVRVADAFVADALTTMHAQVPFDEIWYTSDFLTDLSWYEPSLANIRQMAVLGSNASRLTRLIWSQPDSIQRFGIRSWLSAGRLSSMDGVITDVSPSAYGLREESFADVRSTGLPWPTMRGAPDDPRLVVLVVGYLDSRALAKVVLEAIDAVGVVDRTTFVILHDDYELDGTPAGRSIWRSVPVDMQQATILVAIRSDGVAHSFLDRADVLICATFAELAIPAVRAAAESTATRVLSSSCPPTVSITTATAWSASSDCVVVPVETSQRICDALGAISDTSTIVLHGPGLQNVAEQVAAYDRVAATDLVMVCEPDETYGSVGSKLCDELLVMSPAVRTAIEGELGNKTLPEAIRSVLNPLNVDRVSLQVLPVPGLYASEAKWSGDRIGLLPVAGGALTVGPIVVISSSRDTPPESVHMEPRVWVEGLSWQNRLRLLLPWKWGLLARAMRGKW